MGLERLDAKERIIYELKQADPPFTWAEIAKALYDRGLEDRILPKTTLSSRYQTIRHRVSEQSAGDRITSILGESEYQRQIDEESPWTLRGALQRGAAKAAAETSEKRQDTETDLPPLPEWLADDEPQQPASRDDSPYTVEELLDLKEDRYRRLKEHRGDDIHTIAFDTADPIAIVCFGDPHLDSDGCNIPALRRAVKTINDTPGMMGANLGDQTNNWIGRLARLYAEQSTTFDESAQLAQWLFHACPWLAVVFGNHDKWNHGDYLLRALMRGADVKVAQRHEAKIKLDFPDCDPIRLHMRHSFKGSSIYSRVHGQQRAAIWQPWGDVFIGAHMHDWATGMFEATDGRPKWLLSVRGFQELSEYATERQLQEHKWGETITLLIDAAHPHPCERVRLFFDVETAAEVLTWARG